MARPANPKPTPIKRNGFWYLERRVPKRFRAIEPRALIRTSTRIRVADDPKAVVAKRKVEELDDQLFLCWLNAPGAEVAQHRREHEKATRIAMQSGVPYLTAAEINNLPSEDIIRRFEILQDASTGSIVKDPERRAAILGMTEPAQLFVSDMVDEVHTILAGIHNAKSANQKRKWRVARQSALNTFISAIGGDRPISQLHRMHVIQLREYWQARVLRGEITIESANKYIAYISGMYNEINAYRQLGFPEIFRKSTLPGGKYHRRVAFDAKFVENKILASGVLDGLNQEAHAIVCIIAETGMRLSEACNLNKETIHLDACVPYVSIRADGRALKSDSSARDIPLVGIALEALKSHPEGFRRYVDKASSLSAVVNKYLRLRGLLPVKGQSLYSLRHTFEDRLQALEAPEKLIADLMGHKWHGPRYGAGPTLVQKAKWMELMVYKITTPSNPAQI
jgi:integrase